MQYRNRDTLDVVHRRKRDPRLDSLPHRWELLDGDESGGEQHDESSGTGGRHAQTGEQGGQAADPTVAEPVDAEQAARAERADTEHDEPQVEHDGDEPTVEQPTGPGDPPSRAANRAEWADFAVRAGLPPAQVTHMTKAQLVEHFRGA